MIVFANWGFMSKISPSSTIRLISSYMSYGLRFDSGRTSRSSSSMRSTESLVSRRGGASSQFEGKYDRYSLIAWMHSSSEPTSRSATPDLRVCTREPPSSSWVTSSPVTALTK